MVEYALTRSSIGVISNTTSPSSNHIPLGSDVRSIDVLSQMYGDGFFPVLLCPPALLANIIRINHLRLQAFSQPSTESKGKALALLGRITAFSPKQWAMSCAAPEKGIILDHVYRSAVILYCILSLQSLCVLPRTAQLSSMTVTNTKELFAYLKQACGAPGIGKCMLWPLVVAAVCTRGDLDMHSLSIDSSPLWERPSGLPYLCWRQLFPETSGIVRAEPGMPVLSDHTALLCRLSGCPDIIRLIGPSAEQTINMDSTHLGLVTCLFA